MVEVLKVPLLEDDEEDMVVLVLARVLFPSRNNVDAGGCWCWCSQQFTDSEKKNEKPHPR